MSKAVIASGTTVRIDHELRSRFRQVNAGAIGVASAFVSERGVEEITSLASAARIRQKCLIAGTDYFITHPQALFRARKDGWKVRLGSRSNHGGIFHPKLIVAGRSFDSTGVLRGLSFSYLGSANITRGGLERNVEDGFIATGADCVAGSAEAFAEFWARQYRRMRTFLTSMRANLSGAIDADRPRNWRRWASATDVRRPSLQALSCGEFHLRAIPLCPRGLRRRLGRVSSRLPGNGDFKSSFLKLRDWSSVGWLAAVQPAGAFESYAKMTIECGECYTIFIRTTACSASTCQMMCPA